MLDSLSTGISHLSPAVHIVIMSHCTAGSMHGSFCLSQQHPHCGLAYTGYPILVPTLWSAPEEGEHT